MPANVTRFTSGISTTPTPEDPLANYGAADPTQYHVYFNDFDVYDVTQWVLTTTEAGAGSATEALTDADGGVLLVTNDAADNDLDFFQLVPESFLLEAGKEVWFKMRFKTSDATQSDLVMGLQIKDTTSLDVTDGIYFLKADGAATFDIFVRKDATTGSNTVAAVATLVSDTWTVMAFYYDGVDKVYYYKDGVRLGSLSAVSTYLPDTELTVSFGIQNGEAVAKTLSVDYIFAAKKR